MCTTNTGEEAAINKRGVYARRVLAFNKYKRLIAICASTNAAAALIQASPSSVFEACVGTTIQTHQTYLRFLPDDIEVTLEDLGVLKLQDFDQLAGNVRKVYKTGKMSHKGIKKNTIKKAEAAALKAHKEELNRQKVEKILQNIQANPNSLLQ